MNFCRITADALPAILQMEQEYFSDSWSKKDMEDMLCSPGVEGYVIENSYEICGYCLVRSVLDEGEILRIAVSLRQRNQGIGTGLLKHVMHSLPGIRYWNLEVRMGNESARCCYEKCGFKEIGVRKRYYRNPLEDARVMQWERFL